MCSFNDVHHRRAWPKRQRGAVAVLLTVAMLALLAMAGLALDGGHLLLNKTRLQNAVDAAALSGAKTLSQVMGASGAATTTQAAALNTLTLNASAPGNGELATAIAGNVGGFARVELAASVYGPFSFPGPANASYVKVTVPQYGLAGFFWRFLQWASGGSLGDKQVAAVAVAGPSPTSPCDIAPLMVCGDPTQYDPSNGLFWGFRFGKLEVLKTAAGNSSPIGPGNFQLIRLGSNTGGADIRDALAGGIDKCNTVGNNVDTEPGNKIGPAIQGLNTRFGQYSGPVSPSDYPPDLIVDYSHNGNNALTLNSGVTPERIEYQNSPAHSDSGGNIYTDSGQQLFDYNDWLKRSAECMSGSGTGCQSNGVYERRMLKIVVGKCSGTDGGQTTVPVLGFACYFILQPADQKGNAAEIFGQFIRECEGDNYPGATPANSAGPQIIQLYKTFTNGSGTPGSDS